MVRPSSEVNSAVTEPSPRHVLMALETMNSYLPLRSVAYATTGPAYLTRSIGGSTVWTGLRALLGYTT